MKRVFSLDIRRLGAVAAVLLAVSSFAFFAIAGATTHASPTADPAAFLRDVVAKPGLAATWAWSQAWLGLLTIPLYLGLFAMLRKANGAAAMVSLVTGLFWGALLVIVTPLMFGLVARAAPIWAAETDPAAKAHAF